MTLATMIEAAMPDDASSAYGSGTAGSVWKSMMAEQLGKQMAKAGGIGLASQLEARRRRESARRRGREQRRGRPPGAVADHLQPSTRCSAGHSSRRGERYRCQSDFPG